MNILLPVDGSEASVGAARFLSTLNLGPDDEVNVLHVISFVPLLHDIESYSDVIFRIKQEIAPKILDEILDILRATPARLATSIREGDVTGSIVDHAIQSKADLIVMGAKGLTKLKSILIGSTTHGVISKSPAPVLAVREGQWEGKDKLKILFATDGSEYSDAAGRFLAGMPFNDGTEITVLNIVRSAVHDIPERFFVEVDDRMKGEVAKIRTTEFSASEKIIEKSVEYLKDRFSDINGLTKVGDPSLEILDAAEKLDIDIVVVGCQGHKGLKGIMGSVSRNVMRHAHCSFLICKSC